MSRRKRRPTRGGQAAPPETDAAALALKLLLAHLQDDGTGRVMHVLPHLLPLFHGREWDTLGALIGHLLETSIAGLLDVYGSREAAIDAVSAQLAAKMLAGES